jgi:ribonuclease P protein component
VHEFPKSNRLLKKVQFERVYLHGVAASDHLLVVKAIANECGVPRLGLAVGRAVGNAVHRNRWKRIIREGFRQQAQRIPAGLDFVVRPRKGAACDSRQVAKSLVQLTIRLEKKIIDS